MSTDRPAVQLTEATKVYSQGKMRIRALDGVTLSIPARQFVAVMGSSGSGKSTLLHVTAGLTRLTSGDIALFDQPIASMDDDRLTRLRRDRIGLIFQSFNLLPTLNALENVALPLLIGGARMDAARKQATAMLEIVGLTERAAHRPDELSGGQQQRVAIARALIGNAPLLLADEPTGNLDSATGEDILGLLRRLVTEHGRTVMMVTHDVRAASCADRIIMLEDGRAV